MAELKETFSFIIAAIFGAIIGKIIDLLLKNVYDFINWILTILLISFTGMVVYLLLKQLHKNL